MRFMLTVQIVIPPERAAEAQSLLPAETAYVSEQLQQGSLEAIYFEAATPPVHIWAVIEADSLEEAQRLVASYPLHAFFQVTYTPLR